MSTQIKHNMKESIIIRNFGPINEIEINDIRPFTVFIGESGSGKSTILKVVALFRWIFKMVSIRSYLKQSGISKSPFRFSFNTYIRNNGFEGYLKKNTEIIYINGDCVIEFKNGKLNADVILSKSQLSLEKVCFISDKRNIIPDILANNTEKKSASFFLKETLDDFLLAVKDVRELEFDYLGVKFVAKKTANGEKFFIEGTDDEENPYSIKLEDASSGTQTVTPLSVITEYFSRKYDLTKSFNNAIFSYMTNSDNLSEFKAVTNIGAIKHKRVNIHIEEPELSLYPESQRSLLNYLVTRCYVEKKDYDMTLMMATHSPYIINQINLLILEGRRGSLEHRALLMFEDVDVFEVVDGYLNDLKIKESFIIDTRPLSDPISNIYERYNELNQ